MTGRDKFKAAQSVFSRLSTELTDLPDDNSEESDEDMAPTDIAASGTAAEAEEKLENVHGDTTAVRTSAKT
ncbi:hypothetical protein L917_10637 [Phytophthora nicotianae]|uniref:Uncharacterized protein n=1 Tax=Phytophthora nicotianae TaxID=4792 RepID=W2L064_PHYNI|nr:hypothetical protein L917_10637 [Phytophthora nicotianae]